MLRYKRYLPNQGNRRGPKVRKSGGREVDRIGRSTHEYPSARFMTRFNRELLTRGSMGFPARGDVVSRLARAIGGA